jgi:hypothetical protein
MSDHPKPPAPRDAVALWNAAIAEAYADDAPSTATATARSEARGSDLDRDLVDEGFDLAEIDAMAAASFEAARARHAATVGGKVAPALVPAPPSSAGEDDSLREPVWVADAVPSSNVVPLAPRRRSAVWLAYAVAAAAAAGGAAYVAGHSRREEPPPPPPVVEEPVARPPAPVAPAVPPLVNEAPGSAHDKKAPR